MSTQTTVTLALPKDVYHRLVTAAQAWQRPMTELLVQSITGNLPPVAEDAPPALVTEFAAMQQLEDWELWQIVSERLDPKLWRRHRLLLARNEAGALTSREENELRQLREATDHFVLRRSFVLALLKWRGHSLAPILAEVGQ
jgi:hypothetical protein